MVGASGDGLGYQGVGKSPAIAIDRYNQIVILRNGSMTTIASVQALFNARDGVQHSMWIDL